MKVRYTLEAIGHMDTIHSYIEARNPEAARRVIERIRTAAEQLGEFPHIGHLGLVTGTCEWAVRGLPYIIVHELNAQANEVVVLGIFHGAQDRESDYVK
jgi:plasmid stabilization system protein ParE